MAKQVRWVLCNPNYLSQMWVEDKEGWDEHHLPKVFKTRRDAKEFGDKLGYEYVIDVWE